MSFRGRLTLIAAVAVAVAVAVASAITYVVVRGELRGEVDSALRDRAATIAGLPHIRINPVEPGTFLLDTPDPFLGGPGGYLQLVRSNGDTARRPEERYVIPVTGRARAVAAGKEDAFLTDGHLAGAHVRVLTAPLAEDWALQVARPLEEVDHSLGRIKALLFLVTLGGAGLAAALGLAVTKAALAPVRRLTETAEHVTETRDLASRIDVGGRDELGRLASTFNTMLAALEDSARAQRQLVADASHELRTPLTSLRTNIEVLARNEDMPRPDRERLLQDVVEQLSEMTALIGELVELARGDAQPHEPEDVRLDLLLVEAVARAQRNAPSVRFELHASESVVHGVPGRIERAVANLLDNAATWSPPDGVVEVTVHDGEVIVRDHGPGIADDDLPYVFDRFYRASAARALPGSGLGLAIVKQVAEAHGGAVTAEQTEGGGALMRLRLPPVAIEAATVNPAPPEHTASVS